MVIGADKTPGRAPGLLKSRLRLQNTCQSPNSQNQGRRPECRQDRSKHVVNPPIPEVEITKGSRRKKDGCRECRQDRSKHACGMLILASVGLPTFALARGSRRKRERRGENRTDAKMSPGSSKQACHNASSVPRRSNNERTAAKGGGLHFSPTQWVLEAPPDIAQPLRVRGNDRAASLGR